MNKKFQNLLLDLDGTLIYSGNFLVQLEFILRFLPLLKHHRGWKAAWKSLRASKSILTQPSKIKTNQERLIESFQTHLGLSYEAAKAEVFNATLAVFPKLESHFGSIKGAAKFMDWAKNHYSLTLATNPVWTLELVQMRMRWGGIDPTLFKSITTSDRMHACKPTLDYYQEILAQENFSAESCLLIGNERKMDLPATYAGIEVFLIRPEAKELTQIQEKTDTHAAAWRGNYQHLQEMLIFK